MNNSKKAGVIIAYAALISQTIFNVIFTPILIRSLGVAEYGLYQIVHSFAGYLIILNFGTGLIVTRYVSKFRAEKNHEKQANFLALSIGVTFLLFILVLAIGAVAYFGIDNLFEKSLSKIEISKAKILYIITVLNIGFSLFYNCIYGVLLGYEKFGVSNSTKMSRVLLKYLLLTILLLIGLKSIAIVISDLVVTIFLIMWIIRYAFKQLKIEIKFQYFDKKMILLITSFSLSVFLQAIVNQVNLNIDRVVLGVMTNTTIVATYSISLVIYTMFNSITGILGEFFLPRASQMVASNAPKEQFTDLIIKPGRLQYMLGGGAVVGYILFGKELLNIWVGNRFTGAYFPTVILIVPALIPLIENASRAVLNARMKRLVPSVMLIFASIIKIILTIVFVKKLGYLGAAIATAISIFLGDIIMVNIYLRNYIGINIARMFKEIFRGTTWCLIITSIIMLPIKFLIRDTVSIVLIKCAIFIAIYLPLLYIFSANEDERRLIDRMLKSIKRKYNFYKRLA
jgi:O-antigen/teichoic acid export membrane protein